MTRKQIGVIIVCFIGIVATVHLIALMSEELKLPSPKADEKIREYFFKRHTLLKEVAKKGDVDVLFIGDSQIERFRLNGEVVWRSKLTKFKPGNFGISGDTTSGVLWRVIDGELEGIKPKVSVVMVGTNDLSYREAPKAVVANIVSIDRELKKDFPGSKTVIVGVLPRNRNNSPVRLPIEHVNQNLRKLDNGNDIRYFDIRSKLVDEAGNINPELMETELHLTRAGYDVFVDELTPLLSELTSQPASTSDSADQAVSH